MNYGISRTCKHGVDRYLACERCGTSDEPRFAQSQLYALATRTLARDDRYATELIAYLWESPRAALAAPPSLDAVTETLDALKAMMFGVVAVSRLTDAGRDDFFERFHANCDKLRAALLAKEARP